MEFNPQLAQLKNMTVTLPWLLQQFGIMDISTFPQSTHTALTLNMEAVLQSARSLCRALDQIFDK